MCNWGLSKGVIIKIPTCAVDHVDTAQNGCGQLSTDDVSDLAVDQDNMTVDGLGQQHIFSCMVSD